MSMHLMHVPKWLLAAVETGAALVDGAVVKDAVTGRILAHLQPTQSLVNLLFEYGLAPVTQPLSLLSGVAGNFQLLKLTRMVEQLQMVAAIGAAASVLNLGVSVGGFVMVLRSLQRVQSKVDAIGADVEAIRLQQKAEFLGRCSHALRRAEEAFAVKSAAEQTRYWQEAEKDLDELTQAALHLLAEQGLPLEGPSAAAVSADERQRLLARPAVVDTLRWLTTFSSVRTEVLLCLGHAGIAGKVAGASAAWLSLLPSSALGLAQARADGRPLSRSQWQDVVPKAKAVSVMVGRGREVALERAALCQALDAEGVDTARHMLDLRQDPMAHVLVWLPGDAPSA